MEAKQYTVWVGGVEVNDHYLTKDQATDVALGYEEDGYNDVVIQKVK